MKRRDIVALVSSLEAQGARVRPSKGGYQIQFNEGEGTTIHFTQSDSRHAMKNFRAAVERAGYVYPGRKARHR